MKNRRRAPAILAATVLALGLSACGATGESRDDERWYPDLAALLDDAKAGGAAPEQLDVLERAARQGEMTFEDLNSLADPLSQCLEDAGFQVSPGVPFEEYPGLLIPSLNFVEPPGMGWDEWNALDSACENQYWTFAQIYYVSQPIAVDAFYDDFEGSREAILGCLREHAVTVDDDSTVAELVAAVMTDPIARAEGDWCYAGSIPYVPGT